MAIEGYISPEAYAALEERAEALVARLPDYELANIRRVAREALACFLEDREMKKSLLREFAFLEFIQTRLHRRGISADEKKAALDYMLSQFSLIRQNILTSDRKLILFCNSLLDRLDNLQALKDAIPDNRNGRQHNNRHNDVSQDIRELLVYEFSDLINAILYEFGCRVYVLTLIPIPELLSSLCKIGEYYQVKLSNTALKEG